MQARLDVRYSRLPQLGNLFGIYMGLLGRFFWQAKASYRLISSSVESLTSWRSRCSLMLRRGMGSPAATMIFHHVRRQLEQIQHLRHREPSST